MKPTDGQSQSETRIEKARVHERTSARALKRESINYCSSIHSDPAEPEVNGNDEIGVP